MDLARLTAGEMAQLLSKGEASSREITAACLQASRDRAALGAFLHIDESAALAEADQADERRASGESSPLLGVPVAVKDNICVAGQPTTCASRILEGFVPPYTAACVERLREAGAVVLGKTNLDEFAMGSTTDTGAFGLCRNPRDLDRTPGGSSGGSAAAVAGGLAPLSLGSDTGGSIRLPASFCGIVGFKPTYGRVSRWGLVAFGSSLDQVGPMARTAADAAALASAISGHDPKDATSRRNALIGPVSQVSLRGLKFALPVELDGEGIDSGVQQAIHEAVQAIEQAGGEVRRISLPSIDVGVTTYYIIAPAEASSNLARFDGIRYGSRIEEGGHNDATAATRGRLFGHEVKLRIMTGAYALSAGYYDAFYLRAQQVRAKMTAQFNEALQEADFIISPTAPRTAFRIGEMADDPLAVKLLDLCTIPANLGGFPSISLPAGLSDGLPVGLCLTGPAMSDERLLGASAALEGILPPPPGVA
jgi:aspartyl-tRNA(Asn)/glutamyl-tRNA(Gln) amidotransferase subunit A